MINRSCYYRFPSRDGLVASTLLEYLHQGGRDPVMMREAAAKYLARIREREDCADFKCAYLTLALYRFGDVLPADLFEDIKSALLDFPYEDCGGHAMCTWTENHRLYLADAEYLLAQLFGDDVFGDGRSAAYHLSHGREAILRWNADIDRFGFGEWGSNNYFSETLAAICINFECTREADVRESSRRSLDLLLTEICARSAGTAFNPACSRAYVDNKVSGHHGNYLRKQLAALDGACFDTYKDKESAFIFMLPAGNAEGRPLYELPAAVRAYWQEPVKETALREGLDIRDYRRVGLLRYSPENVRFAMQSGAISDHRLISNSFRYFDETGMADNGFFKPFRPLIKPILYKTPLLRIIKFFCPLIFDAAAHGEGRVYTYTTERVSLSAAFDYRVGKPLYQQNPFAVNLSPKISLFATNPYKSPEKTGSPDYWIGGASAPQAAAYRNTLAAVFRPRRGKGIGRMTHLFFPVELFDEVDLSHLQEGLLFGRSGDVNVMVRTNPGAAFRTEGEDASLRQDLKIQEDAYTGPYDLENRAKGLQYYIFEVDETLPFAEFTKARIAPNIRRTGRRISFRSAGHDFALTYRGRFQKDGVPFEPDFIPLNRFYNNLLSQEVSNE